MRRGFTNLWKYDSFPIGAPIVSIDGEQISAEELPGTFVEREYDRQFSHDVELLDNDEQLAKFRKLAGITPPKVTKVVTRVSGMTRREETYARLAEKYKGNKWFDDNA